MTGNTINPASEVALLDNMAIPAGNHNGGDLHIGGDGDLYVSVGDGGANPRGGGRHGGRGPQSSERQDPAHHARRRGARRQPLRRPGRARCHARRQGISTPTNAKCTEIYSYGLRNPFRIAFNPNTGNSQFFINDVGENTWEEVNLGGKGSNYGWNNREGFCNTGSTTTCPPTPAGFTDPLTAYQHAGGCTFITAGAFVPKGVFPPQYDDSYLFADGGCGKMWLRTPGGVVDYATPFAQTTGTIVDMDFMSIGGVPALVYVTNGGNQIHKITYTRGSSASDFVALAPARLADTRSGQATVDGLFQGIGIARGGSTMELTVGGRGGVPLGAGAASLNVTAKNGAAAGFATVFPCGVARPTTSSLNYTAGATVPNAVVSKLGSDGKVCIYVSVDTDIVVDVGGYFPLQTSLASITPARVLDTRPGHATDDGSEQGAGLRGAGSITVLPIAGRLGIPSNIPAVVLNITVTEAAAAGYVTVYPCGGEPPLASNINVAPGATVANQVVTKIGAGGSVCIFTQSPLQLIGDVVGYFSGPTTYAPLVPARLLETRNGASTVDGLFNGGGIPAKGTVTTLRVTGRGGVPSGASTAVLNVTATDGVGRRVRHGVSVRYCDTARVEPQLLGRYDCCKCNNREACGRRHRLPVQFRTGEPRGRRQRLPHLTGIMCADRPGSRQGDSRDLSTQPLHQLQRQRATSDGVLREGVRRHAGAAHVRRIRRQGLRPNRTRSCTGCWRPRAGSRSWAPTRRRAWN